MRCANCGENININWNFCPGCGRKIPKNEFLSVFDKMCEEVLNEIDGSSLIEKSRIKKIVEPKTIMRVDGIDKVYEIHLPNVDSEKVNIRKIGASLEVRALSKNTLFFKVLKAPENAFILDKQFENDRLRLRVRES